MYSVRNVINVWTVQLESAARARNVLKTLRILSARYFKATERILTKRY